jgi:hypothetical protein
MKEGFYLVIFTTNLDRFNAGTVPYYNQNVHFMKIRYTDTVIIFSTEVLFSRFPEAP